MARSSKPIVWLPFAAGGTLSAFLLPALIIVTGVLVPLGLASGAFSYGTMRAFAASLIGKVILAGVILPCLWHGAHRLRMTLQDLFLRGEDGHRIAGALCYGIGAVLTLLCGSALLTLW
ncbi:fumarate reductase subunit FrdD [Novispirillum itersonii]|uniref:fumarate reductase subunit FrdD n=1 Tax=Novispirillum itersonii TaxID=189 RepID=UPI000381F527|nr:fumarate reductase subunit FrdD [Novispirillum itersonii]